MTASTRRNMDDRTPVLLSWSGGKDSTLALAALHNTPEWRVVGLLTTLNPEHDRISMHGVRSSLLRKQAAALGLPLIRVDVPTASTNAAYGERMRDVLSDVQADGIHTVAFGDLFLHDVRSYREAMLAQVGMSAIFPVWGIPTDDLAHSFISGGFRAILSCVDTEQIDGRFAGRDYDLSLLDELPDTADPCGENGEFHTFVHDGPLFERPVRCERGDRVLRNDRFMYQDLV